MSTVPWLSRLPLKVRAPPVPVLTVREPVLMRVPEETVRVALVLVLQPPPVRMRAPALVKPEAAVRVALLMLQSTPWMKRVWAAAILPARVLLSPWKMRLAEPVEPLPMVRATFVRTGELVPVRSEEHTSELQSRREHVSG